MKQEPNSRVPEPTVHSATVASAGPSTLDLGANFYGETSRQLVACCGHEVGTPDYHAAVDLLNKKLRLGLDTIEERALSYMLTALSNSQRFGGEVHINPVQAENSAAHSAHSVILANEIFRRAALLSPEQDVNEVESLRKAISLGCLVHDMGEILGELSSLAQRAAHTSVEEMPDIEREIFRITLTEAFRAAGELHADSATFYSFIQTFRNEAELGRGGITGTCQNRLALLISRYAQQQEDVPLRPDLQERVNAIVRMYDLAEMKTEEHSPSELLRGNAVKVIEHLQGLRHFMRFAGVEAYDHRLHLFSPESHREQGAFPRPTPAADIIPLRYMSSARLVQNCKYIEKELPELFTNASTRVELGLAHALRDAAYQCQIEWFSIGRCYVHREPALEDTPIASLQKQVMAASSQPEKCALLGDLEYILRIRLNRDREMHRRQKSGGPLENHHISALLPYVDRGQVIMLYTEALRLSFVPTSPTPLLMLPEVPHELRGFMSRASAPTKRPSLPGQQGGLTDMAFPPQA